MNEVTPSVGDAFMDTAHYLFRLASRFGAMLGLGPVELTLCLCQSLLLLTEETRVLDTLAITESGELFQPHIHADCLRGRRQGLGLDFNAEAGEPLLTLSSHRAGFDLAFDSAMQNCLDGSY